MHSANAVIRSRGTRGLCMGTTTRLRQASGPFLAALRGFDVWAAGPIDEGFVVKLGAGGQLLEPGFVGPSNCGDSRDRGRLGNHKLTCILLSY